MFWSQNSSACVTTSVLGRGPGKLLEPQVAQKVGGLAQLVTPAATVPAFPAEASSLPGGH